MATNEHGQSQHRHHGEETAPPPRARDIILIMISAVSSANRGGLDISVVAVIGRGEEEYRCLSARQKSAADHLGPVNGHLQGKIF